MIRLLKGILSVMKNVNADTHLWCISVLAGAILLCISFFVDPAQRQLVAVDSEDVQKIATANVIEYSSVLGALFQSEDADEEVDEIVVDQLSVAEVRENALLYSIDEIYADVSSDSSKDDLLVTPAASVDMSAQYSAEAVDELERLVQSEAATEDLDGRILVANVVLNRIDTGIWGDDLQSVISSPGQFEPVDNGAYKSVVVDSVTKNAVLSALGGEDLSKGAIYFQKSNAKVWGNKKFLFRHGSHSFYN